MLSGDSALMRPTDAKEVLLKRTALTNRYRG